MSTTYERHRTALAEDPDNTAAFEALEEHAFLEGAWDDLAALYRRRLEAPSLASDPQRRVPVLYRLGQILEERCNRVEEAEQVYWEIVSVAPGFRPALRQLRHIHSARGQSDMVLQIAELEGQTEMTPAERSRFTAELGEIWLDQLDHAGEALAHFERALEVDPAQQRALLGMARAQQALGRAEEAARSYEQLATIQRGPERAPVLVALGKLYGGPLRDLERASACLRGAMTDDPRNLDAVESLVVIASAQEKWQLLADLFERRFDLASGARHRSAIALEAGNMLLHRLRSRDAARSWYERARELADDDVAVHQAMAELERMEGDNQALRYSLDRVIELSGKTAPVSVLLEAADLHAEAGQRDRALRYLELAQARKPDDPLVLEALSDALTGTSRTADLANVLERRAALAFDDPQTQSETLCELSRLYEEELGDPESALSALQRAFDANPQLGDVTARLQRLYRKTERFDELRQLLERAREQGSAERRSGASCELGQLLLEHYRDVDGARLAFEQALALHDGAARALQGLEQVARLTGDEDMVIELAEREAATTRDPERMLEIVQELTPLFEARADEPRALHWVRHLLQLAPGRREALELAARLQAQLGLHDDLASTLVQLDAQLTGAAGAANQLRLAAVHDERGDEEAALAAIAAAVEYAPDDVDALRELTRRQRAAHRHAEAAAGLRRLADLLPPAESTACLDELATLLADELGDVDAAIVVMWRVVGLPTRPEHAAERLESLLDRAGRYEELAQQLSERRRALPDASDEADALDLRRARVLMDKLGQLEQAAALYRAVRSRDPGNHEATEGLEQALRSGNDSAGLALLLESRARNESDPLARVRLEYERAVLLEDELGDHDGALSLFESLADQSHDEGIAGHAALRLERGLERRGDWAALRERLETALARSEGAEEWALRERIAAICRDRLADREGCIAHLEAMGRMQPERTETWRDLEQLYRELGRGDDWLRVAQAELDTSPDRERELVLRVGAARLHLQRAAVGNGDADGERASAREHYERVLALAPAHSEASEFLIDHYEHGDRPEEVVRLLHARLAACIGSADAAEGARTTLELRIAGLQADRLDDLEGAIATLEDALPHAPDLRVVAEPLAALYTRGCRDTDLAMLCRRAIDVSTTPDERAGWQVRLGEALRRSGELRDASEAFCTALTDRPGDREIEAVLRAIYRELDDPQPLAALIEAEIPRATPTEQVALRMELAQLLTDRLDRAEEALPQLQAVLDLDRDHDGAFGAAMKLSERLGREQEMLDLLDARLAGNAAPDVRASWLERRAQLLAGPLDRPEEAVSAYRQVISLDGERHGARLALREILEQLGRWPAVLDCLHVEAGQAEGEARVAILERALAIASERLSGDAALPWLERLRAERPEDPEIVARIGELHRAAGRREAYLRALDAQLELVDDAQRRRDIHVHRARVLARDLQSPGRAIAAFESALELAPGDLEVLAELDRLYDLMGRVHERVDVIAARIPATSGAERIALHREAAMLYATSLAEPAHATPHLLHALALARKLEPGDGEGPGALLALLRELGETLRASGRLDAWVRAAEAELELLGSHSPDDRRRRAELHDELAYAYGPELGLPEPSLRHLLALQQMAETAGPGGEPPLSRERSARAEERLIDALRAERNHVGLAELLRARLDRGSGGTADWIELARLEAEALHAPAAAAEAWREAIARQPGNLEAIRGLRHAAQCTRDWTEVARSLDLELDARADASPRELSVLQKKLGDICWHRLGSLERAAEAFAAGLEAAPGDVETIRCLRSVQERREQWADAADLYEREVELLGPEDAEQRRSLWLAVARLAREQLGDRARALRAYENAAAEGALGHTDQRIWSELYREAGDVARYAETGEVWCDDPDSDAGAWDHLALVGALLELGRPEAALRRALRASEVDPRNADAWDRVAELRRQLGDSPGAREALEQAAALHEPHAAAGRLVEAAALCDAGEAEEAAALLRRAIECDPSRVAAHASLAANAEGRGDLEEAEQAAGRALDLAAADDEPQLARELATALVGGRAAHALSHLESAARFYARALELDAGCHEALDAQCEVLFAQQDFVAARKLAEARLELPGKNPARAWQLAVSARGLEAAGDDAPALARYREALEVEAGLALAHEGITRIHEQGGRGEAAVKALELWIASEEAPDVRARCHLRAARHLQDAGRSEAAEAHLRDALADAPGLEEAWVLLVDLLARLERAEDVLEVGDRALEQLRTPAHRAPVALATARILEARGEPRRAADRYAEAARADDRCVEAALSAARLLRGIGEWAESAEALDRFLTAHPEPRSIELAQLHLERGRLMAGPLEQVEEAIACYERALTIRPDLAEAREPLAALLAHVPERWREALYSHRALLDAEPTRSASMRALLEIARRREMGAAVGQGLALLRALGSATPEEAEQAPQGLPLPLGASLELADPVWETARRICNAAAQEIGEGLAPEPAEGDGFSQRLDAAFAELAAPGLLELSAEELSSVVYTVTALAADPGGNCNDGPFLHRLDEALGRWTRRKIRKVLGPHTVREIQSIDYEAWREALRLNAACLLLDSGGADLRAALLALAGRGAPDDPGLCDATDLTSLVAGSAAARRLLDRVVTAWCAHIAESAR